MELVLKNLWQYLDHAHQLRQPAQRVCGGFEDTGPLTVKRRPLCLMPLQVDYGNEFFMVNRAFKAIRRADVVLLMVDVEAGITDQVVLNT